jgi:hypothetical protein
MLLRTLPRGHWYKKTCNRDFTPLCVKFYALLPLKCTTSLLVILEDQFFRYKLVEGEGRNTTLKEDFLTTSYNPEAIFIHLFLDLKVSVRDPSCISIDPDILFHPGSFLIPRSDSETLPGSALILTLLSF